VPPLERLLSDLLALNVFNTAIYILKYNYPVNSMIYTRNKDCFKKTTAKVEHREAQKNILNLLQGMKEKEGPSKLSIVGSH
jgi:hypothetical protein